MSSAFLMDTRQNVFSEVTSAHCKSLSVTRPLLSALNMASSADHRPNLRRVWPPPSVGSPERNSSETGKPAVKPKVPLKKPPIAKKPATLPSEVAHKLNAMVPPPVAVSKPVAAVRPQVRPRTSAGDADKTPMTAPVPAKRNRNAALPQKGPVKVPGSETQNLNSTSNGNSANVPKPAFALKPLPPPKPRKSKIQEFRDRRLSSEDDITTETGKREQSRSPKEDEEEWLDEDAEERQRLASINSSAIPQILKYKRQQSIHGRRQSRKTRSKSPDFLARETNRKSGSSQKSAIESDGDSTDSYDDVEVFEEISRSLPSSVKSETNETPQEVSPVKVAMAKLKLAETNNNAMKPAHFKVNTKQANAVRPLNRRRMSAKLRKASHKEIVVLPPSPTRNSPKVKSSFAASLENTLNKTAKSEPDSFKSPPPPIAARSQNQTDLACNLEDDDCDYEVMHPEVARCLSVSSNESEHSYVDPAEVDRLASISGRNDNENIFSDPDQFPMYVDPNAAAPYMQTSHSSKSSSCESLIDTPKESQGSRPLPAESNVSQEKDSGLPPCPPRFSSLMPAEFNILAAVTQADQKNLPQKSSSVPTSSSSPPLPMKRNARSPHNRAGGLSSTFEKLKDEKESTQKGACGIKRNRKKSRYVDTAPMFQEYQKEEKARIAQMMREIPEDEEADKDQNIPAPKPSYRSAGTLQRTLWSDLPEVRQSGVLKTLTRHDLKLQETIFEVITSEASYLHSLNIFIENFVENIHILSKLERKQLFSNIEAIRDVSERFLLAMENRQEESIVLVDVCDIVQKFAEEHFQCYVLYCSNQSQQMRTYEELMAKSAGFKEIVKQLEARPVCEALPFQSFITLPMQRITRLPLLIENIFHRVEEETLIYKSARTALLAIKKNVRECNEGARKMDRLYEMYEIQKQLKMNKHMALVSEQRWLVKKGELSEIKYVKSRNPFSSTIKPVQERIHLFLFTDLVLVTRKKSDGSFVVEDHCLRNMCQVQPVEFPQQHPLLKRGVPANCMNIFILVLLENYQKKQREIILNTSKLSDRQRWVDVLSPDNMDDDDYEEGKVYEAWDCPQVQCVEAYTSSEPDELSLEESDIINVYRKLPDGWYEGERLRDGEKGWFPAANVEEILSQHVRAKNLRERYRLLCISQCFLQTKFGDLH